MPSLLFAAARLYAAVRSSGRAAVFVYALALPLLLLPASHVFALEEFSTTAMVVDKAVLVLHGRVRQSRPASGGAVREYDIEVLEVLKSGGGEPGGLIRVRIFSGLRSVMPSGTADEDGAELIFILGAPVGGVYPLRSLEWGRIELGTDEETGATYLLRRLTGYPPPVHARFYSLDEFRELVGP